LLIILINKAILKKVYLAFHITPDQQTKRMWADVTNSLGEQIVLRGGLVRSSLHAVEGKVRIPFFFVGDNAIALPEPVKGSQIQIGIDPLRLFSRALHDDAVDVGAEMPSEGVVTPLLDGVRAALDSEYLEDLKRHTRRGMIGRVRDGLSAGGLTYGYAPGGKKGERVIVEHEAAIVRRIFEEYAAGRSPRIIAERLNTDGVKPPRGSDWQASVINGNSVRGSGILMNALYDGRLMWNRVSMHKDPDTGRRVSRANPEREWITKPVPHLRIVEAELFAKVQAAKTARGKQRPEKAHRPKHLLAGLLRCGCCGSAMAVNNVKTDSRRIYCGRRKEGGRCANGKTHKLGPIEARVVTALKAQLTDPRAIERYLTTYQAERKRLAKEGAGKRAPLERTLAQAKREIDRLVDAIAMGTVSDGDARKRLAEPRRRRDAAEVELAALVPPVRVTELHPAAVTRYLAAVEDLAGTLSRRTVSGDEDVASALRELISAVIVHPVGKDPRIEVRGRLAQLTGATELFPQQEIPPTVVAGVRYIRQKPSFDGHFTFAA
jgi:site-specific DNA recombinase